MTVPMITANPIVSWRNSLFISSVNAVWFFLSWQRFCSHCYMSLAPQVPWEANDRPASLYLCGSGSLCPVSVRRSCCNGPGPHRQRGANTCGIAERLTHRLCSEGTVVNSHFLTFLILECWKIHPGGLKQDHLTQNTGVADWERQSFWALMSIILIYEMSHAETLYVVSGSHIACPHLSLTLCFFS